MPTTRHITELPDPVYGRTMVGIGDDSRVLTVSSNGPLLHAFLGDNVYIAMSERNWATLFQTLQRLDIVTPPQRTVAVTIDDTARTANATVVSQ